MGKAEAGRPFRYGLPADTRSLEGGPPFRVRIKKSSIAFKVNVDYQNNILRKSTQLHIFNDQRFRLSLPFHFQPSPSVVAMDFDAACSASKK